MAFLAEGRLLITDASNVPINGGKARIYETGGTTLADVFSDAALTVPLTNPVVANSSGFTPVIFGAEGLTVDITYLTAADATVPGRTYTAVPLVGADNGVFSRTLADNTRVQITGAGGIVLVQAGSASPDDVGGYLTLEGYAGTQGDTLTLDFATTNTTGRITEIGKKLPGIVYTPGTTFAAAATVDIPLTADPTGARAWEIFIYDLMLSASQPVYLRFSYDGGGTYKSGAGDYQYGWIGHNTATPASSAGTAAQIIVNAGHTVTANRPGLLKMTIIAPTSGSDATLVMGDSHHLNITSGLLERSSFSGMGIGAFGKATHMRLLFGGGATGTGAYRVVPLRGFGEA